jgi:two-component system cell cycle sensor histidine kinase/response regulator CckA
LHMPRLPRRFILHLACVSIFFALIVALGYAYYGSGKRELVRREHEKLYTIADLKADRVQAWLASRKVDAALILNTPPISRAFIGCLESGSELGKKESLQCLEALRKTNRYRSAFLLNREGRIVLSTGREETLNAGDFSALQQSLETKEIKASDIEKDGTGKAHLDIIAPLSQNAPGPPHGALVLRIDPETYLYPSLRDWPAPSQSAETLLVRRDGNDVLFLNDLRHRKNTALSYRIPLNRADLPAAMIVRGVEHTVEGRDYRGAKVLFAGKAITGTPWFLVTKIDAAEVYAPLQNRAIISALLSLLFLAALVSLLWVIWRQREAEFLRIELREQTRAAAEIAESEENLAVTIGSIGDAVIATDRDGRVTRMNTVAEHLTGWPLVDAIGRTLDEVFVIVNEETRLPVENPVRKVLETGSIVGLANHTALIARDGSELPIADSGAPIKDRDGNILGVVLVFRGQKEERSREKEIINARDFYLTLFEEFPALIRRSGIDTSCNYFNKTWLKFRARTVEEEISDGWTEGVHPEDRDRCRQSFLAAFHTGKPFEMKYRLRRRDGEYRWICDLGLPYNDLNGVFSGYIDTCYDITDQKYAQDSLKESEKMLREVFQATPDMVLLLDRERRIIHSNWHGILQGVPQETRDRKPFCYEVLHNGLESFCEYCPTLQVLDSASPCITEMTFPDHMLFEVRSYPIIDNSGQVTLVVQNFRDITDHRKTEEQLRHSQKMEAIGTLAGGIAHDFNNILTIIVGYGNILKTKLHEDDPNRDDLAKILTAADRAAALTRGLLAYSRKGVINLRYLEINEIVAKVDRLLSRIIGEDINLTVLPAAEKLVVMADEGQIEQVLMNLAGNAREAMQNRGNLLIELKKTTIDAGFIAFHGYGKIGEYALITVSDNGVGMDEATRKRIFEPFFTTKEVGKGTGLGLAIVYGIVKRHNGYINVYSEPITGTTFRIFLPLSNAVPENRPCREDLPIKGNGESILLIEDSEDIRAILGTILNECGYRVIVATDGEEGVEMFIRHHDEIDLLLLDVIMPRKNGRETFDAIRTFKHDVKALFMSGYAADAINRKGIDTEGLELLSKPFSPLALLAKVREILDQPGR